jgi:hypothetical protein
MPRLEEWDPWMFRDVVSYTGEGALVYHFCPECGMRWPCQGVPCPNGRIMPCPVLACGIDPREAIENAGWLLTVREFADHILRPWCRSEGSSQAPNWYLLHEGKGYNRTWEVVA